MNPVKRKVMLSVLLAFALVAARANLLYAQVRQNEPASTFLDSLVPVFEVKNETLLSTVEKLALSPAPFGFGFESLLKSRFQDPDPPQPRLSLALHDKTVRQVLDALCAADGRYTWSVDGPIVNLYPRATVSDSSYLLNRTLETFRLENASDAQDGLLAIARQLPPPTEQIAIAQVGGGDAYPPEPWTVTLHNVTVRQVVDQLALRGGRCAVWIFGGSKDFRHFGFFNTNACRGQPVPQRPT